MSQLDKVAATIYYLSILYANYISIYYIRRRRRSVFRI